MLVKRALPLVFALAWSTLYAQTPPDILHEPPGCVGAGQYLVLDASIRPGSEIRAAKVYFRSDKHPKFYFVEMSFEGDGFRCILPRASAETDRIIYYIEAVDVVFNNTISDQHTAEVRETCDAAEPPLVDLPGEQPGIIVGATEAGAPVLPPGFEAVGIIGTLTSSGLYSGLGGGSGIGTAVAVSGAAAGVGGVVVATNSPPETTTTVPSTTTPAGPGTTTIPGTTTAPATTTVPGTTTVPTTTTTIAGTTTTTIAGTTTTTAPPQTTTTTSFTLTACFTTSDADGAAGCRVAFDASCSIGEIVNYEWRFQDNPPGTVSGPSPTVIYDWSDDPSCGTGFSRLVRLTVRASDGTTAQTQAQVNPTSASLVEYVLRPYGKELQSSLTSTLLFPPPKGRIEAQVVLGGAQADVIDNSAPHIHRFTGQPGWKTIEGYITSPNPQPVLWRFDFSQSEHFRPGSIRVDSGSAVTQDARSVVIRMSGTVGERIKLKFFLDP